MPGLESYAEFVKGTLRALLVDCSLKYPGLAKGFDRDYSRLSSAIDEHGVRFALDVMPRYRKHFDQCLDNGRLTSSNLTHFGVEKRGGVVPRLFKGLILRVFDRSGALQHCPDLEAVRYLRQLLGVFRRLRIDSDDLARYNAVREFFRTDMEVKNGSLLWDSLDEFDPLGASALSFTDGAQVPEIETQGSLFPEPPSPQLGYSCAEKIQQVADLISSTMGDFHPELWKLRHGPGAVSDQQYGDNKYRFTNWPDRLERVFANDIFAHANLSLAYDEPDGPSGPLGVSRKEYPSKLIAVPKILTTPRLIASEPVSNQWCQQSVKDYFYRRTRETFISRFVSFNDQTSNGSLALRASHGGSHATIDLSSASDRVSCWHVERLFRRLPYLLDSLQASRSAWITQDICRKEPRYHKVRKFSTMGNATIFPVQSLFFLSVALGVTLHKRNLKVNFRNIRDLGKWQVRVFGDDIIVPRDCSAMLVEVLEALGLRVNSNKTFTVGNFRESCGVDAFSGHDVTTVNILDLPRRASPGSIVSSVDVHHNLCNAGFCETASFLQKIAARAVSNKIRFVKHGSGLFGWSDLFGVGESLVKTRFNHQLQRVERRTLTTHVVQDRLPSVDTSGFLQFFTEAAKKVTSVSSTLGYLGRRPQTKLRLRWAPDY